MSIGVLQPLRFAARSLARSPGFVVLCVLMLAAGIGLSAYMFGMIQGFVLQPLPFEQPQQLVFVGYDDPDDPGDDLDIPMPDLLELRAGQSHFEDLAGFYEGTVNLGGVDGEGAPPERYDGLFVTASMFSLLRVQALFGRVLEEHDNRPGAAPVAVIGHALWRNRFAQDPAVVGRQVRLNGRPATIVGVMPEGFRFPRMQQVWLPMVLDGTVQPRAAAVDVEAFGRLAPGSSLAAARAGLDALLARINAAHPELLRSERTLVEPYAQWMMGEDVRQVLYTMFAAVLLVLLIACANVANLMLARGLGRARELAIRGALGAARRRLMLQVLCESLLIAMAAAVLGLLGAWLGGEATMRAIHGSGDAPVYWQRFSMDAATVAFCVAVALVAAVAAGVLPALQAARTPVAQSMRSGGSGAIGARRGGIGRTLAVVQIALCMVLLVGAGLTVRSVLKVQSVDLGVDTANVLTGRIGLFEADYPDGDAQRQAIASLQRTLEDIPGVRSAALATALPATSSGEEAYFVEGRAPPVGSNYPDAWAARVTPSYFDLFSIGLLEGRLFDARDRADAAPVAVVNQAFAQREWPHGSALGQRVRLSPLDPESRWSTVIGVVPDTVQGAVESDNRAAVYVPLAQQPARFLSIALKTRGRDPHAFSAGMRAAVAAVDPGLPVYWLRSMEEWLAIGWWDARLMAQMFSVFGLFALVLAASGIYAVLAYAIGQRTREIGVRRALGADSRGIVAMVLGQGAWQLALGVGIGLVLSLAFARLLANVLFQVQAHDPATFAAVAGVLGLAVLVASLLPSRQALRVSPMVALRQD